MMTDEERAQYAREQRERCRPLECHMSLDCWVAIGGAGSLKNHASAKASRCAACNGVIRYDEWTYPRDLALTPAAELEARNHSKRSL